MSFSSSACERPLCVGGALAPSWGAVEASEALEVGRVVLEALLAGPDDDETGRGVQRRLYMHSAGGVLAGWGEGGQEAAGRTVPVEDVEVVEDHVGGLAGRGRVSGRVGEGRCTCGQSRGSSRGQGSRMELVCNAAATSLLGSVHLHLHLQLHLHLHLHALGTRSMAVHGNGNGNGQCRQSGAACRGRLKQASANGSRASRVGLAVQQASNDDVVVGSGNNLLRAWHAQAGQTAVARGGVGHAGALEGCSVAAVQRSRLRLAGSCSSFPPSRAALCDVIAAAGPLSARALSAESAL